jgi:class 3 adenylate cyclase/tetratricopeptide (TPR) repeat protein
VAREQRKTVTVLFCDIVGSTALGDSTDPEAVKAVLARYFERMRSIVELHGGTVARFAGDAVMAVFGVPAAHEDDGLRALRAAAAMREALPDLGVEARLGVNTGEVVTVNEEWLVTGDPVNVAARLQQAAAPGEILVGAATLATAGEAVVVDELAPLELKGKAKPVAAFRLVTVGEAPERRHDLSFVGRGVELALLEGAWQRALEGQRCELVTVVGEPGIGKSRLVGELLNGLDARVVRGRCLPYGEGITYSPVVEVVKQLGVLPADQAVTDTIASLLGATGVATSPEEIAWAFRKLLEQEAPLVVVFDDIQWGEETFLDLVEHVALLSSGAALLLLCLARPELSERRPQWPVTLKLEALPEGEVESLLADIPASLRSRIVTAAGGNALFVTEMLAVATGADGDVEVPPTLKALLAMRLDQLDHAHRDVLECGSVEGELFHRGSVQALTGDASVTPSLAALVRKDLLRPDRPILPGEDGFRFRHLLIRDAAYDAVPKSSRADLHQRFADWLADHSADLVERDELLGYHLEQAHNYRSELGTRDAALGERVAAHLTTAAQRARDRGDASAETKLLERALAAGISDPQERARAEIKLAYALIEAGRLVESERVIDDVAAVAEALADRSLAAHAAFALRSARAHLGDWPPPAVVDDEIETFIQFGDDLGLSRALQQRAARLVRHGQFAEGQADLERALVHAEACGDREQRRRVIRMICVHLSAGPAAVGPATPRAEELLSSAADDWVLEAYLKPAVALLYAMAGRFEEALALASESIGALADLGSTSAWTTRGQQVARALEDAGDRAGAERERKAALAYFRDLRPDTVQGGAWLLGGALARLYCDEDRWEDAEEALAYGRDAAIPMMPMSQITRLTVEARLAAHRGEFDEAVAFAERAVADSANREWLNNQADCWRALAEVQQAAGRTAEADAAIARALELYERKGNVAAAARMREKFDVP